VAALCLAAFTINLDTTIVNIALPSWVVQLDASTRELHWVVDADTLTFVALVLAAGSLGDDYGRKGALLTWSSWGWLPRNAVGGCPSGRVASASWRATAPPVQPTLTQCRPARATAGG
jgi:MFS family permease